MQIDCGFMLLRIGNTADKVHLLFSHTTVPSKPFIGAPNIDANGFEYEVMIKFDIFWIISKCLKCISGAVNNSAVQTTPLILTQWNQ
jgi:hypothetical protein